jgi:hypothetical protein
LIDITPLPNELNTKRQGKGKLLIDVFSNIKAFEKKFKLINKHVEERYLAHLSSCKSVFETFADKLFARPKEIFSEIIQVLQNEFSARFNDFHSHSSKILLPQNPF